VTEMVSQYGLITDCALIIGPVVSVFQYGLTTDTVLIAGPVIIGAAKVGTAFVE